MEAPLALLGGGIMLFVVFPLLLLLFLFLPWWSLIDLLRREDNRDTRVLWGFAMVLLWGIMSIFYALFSTHSRGLRRTTVFCLVGVPLALSVSFLSLSRFDDMGRERVAEEIERTQREFDPQRLDPSELQPIVASRPGGSTGRSQVGLFRLDGPAAATMRPVEIGCSWVALDTRRQQHYCLSRRSLTRIDFENDLTTEITPSTENNFGHFGGLAYDAENDRVIVVSNSGSGGLFAYDPGGDRWEKIAVPGGDFDALAWSDADGTFYAIPRTPTGGLLERIQRYNAHGALIGSVNLSPRISLGERSEIGEAGLQLVWQDGWLHLVLTREPAPASVFAVDPASGAVYAAG